MKKVYYKASLVLVAIWSCAVVATNGEVSKVVKIDRVAAEKELRFRIDLINEIIRNPAAASVKNWNTYLGNPNTYTEDRFHVNSVSDGTTYAWESIGKEGRSGDEQSALLQYLRLSFMAYYGRLSPVPSQINVTNVVKRNSDHETAMLNVELEGEVDYFDVEGFFSVINCYRESMQHPIRIRFYVQVEQPPYEMQPRSDKLFIYLESISIHDHEIFGWWYKIDNCPDKSPYK